MNASQDSYNQLIAVDPIISSIAPLRALVGTLPDKTCLHAGPPFPSVDLIPSPVRNAATVTAMNEGWVSSTDQLIQQLASGEIKLKPAQDFGVVTPLAFVVGPSTYCVAVADARNPQRKIMSPINDGPPPLAPRFGVFSDHAVSLAVKLNTVIGEQLADALMPDIRLLPILAQALVDGDDLHGHVAATQAEVRSFFNSTLGAEARTHIEQSGQFVLNFIMATAALLLNAGNGVEGSTMVTACGGNGVALGYKVGGEPSRWITRTANRPIGPKFPQFGDHRPLPAVGDSAVIDALGFGAACLRFCPTLTEAFAAYVHPESLTTATHDPFLGPHPAFNLDGLQLGLDISRPHPHLGITLGMVEETGTHGLIGRGIAPWPSSSL